MLINHESFKFRLEAEGICSEEKLPSVSSINRIVRSNKRYDHSASSNSSDGSNSNNLSSFGGNANNTLASNSTAAAADALSSSSPMSNLNVAAGLKLNQFNNQLFNLAALASSSANAKNDFSKNLFKMAQTVQRHHLNNRNHDDYLANTTTTSTNTTLDNGEGDEDETVNEFGTDENHLNSHNNTYDDNNDGTSTPQEYIMFNANIDGNKGWYYVNSMAADSVGAFTSHGSSSNGIVEGNKVIHGNTVLSNPVTTITHEQK